jgi:phage-related protein
MSKPVVVRFLGDTSDFQRAARSISGETEKLGAKISGAMKAAAVASGAALVGLGARSVQVGVDFNETLSKVNTIFGKNAAAIDSWAKGAAKGFGQSRREALDAAGTFGNMFTQLGIGTGEAAGMSMKMTELASDFASFHNAAPTDVLEAMSAAFRGEYDAVQRYVPTINAAAVEQKALAMGLKGTAKELTAQDKALATNALLTEGAGQAAGDFQRTAGDLANKTRTAKAQIDNMQVSIGTKLNPVLLKAWDGLEGLVSAFAAAPLPVKLAVGAVAALAAGLVVLNVVQKATIAIQALFAQGTIGLTIAQKVAAGASKVWAAAQAALNVVLTMNPIGLVVIAIAALVAAFVLAWRHSETFRNIVKGAFEAIGTAAGAMRDAFSAAWEGIKSAGRTAINFVIRNVINPLIDGINRLIDGFNRLPGVPDLPKIQRLAELGGTGGTGWNGGDTARSATGFQRRATGGPVSALTPYLVGERGPELFVPGASGSIIPNHALGGGTVNVTINMPAGTNEQAVVDAIRRWERRNGPLARA